MVSPTGQKGVITGSVENPSECTKEDCDVVRQHHQQKKKGVGQRKDKERGRESFTNVLLKKTPDPFWLPEQRVGGAQNLSLDMRKLLIESEVFADVTPLEKSRYLARKNLLSGNIPIPAAFKNPQAHHDLIWAERNWFAQHGLDVNKPEYCRWVEGTPRGGAPVGIQYHQNWSKAFEDEWLAFKAAERPDAIYTREQILAKMQSLRGDFPSGGRRIP